MSRRTKKKSRGNDGAVESQRQGFPSSHQPLGNRCRDFHIPTAPTATYFSFCSDFG